MNQAQARRLMFSVLIVALGAAVLAGLLIGEVAISPGDAWRAVLGRFGIGDGSTLEGVFWSIRAPRVAAAVLVGAALATSGTALQGVYRNPMADPYLLGISSAAGLGTAIAITITPAATPVAVSIAAAAVAGAAFSVFTRSVSRATVDPERFILVGVVLGVALLSWTVVLVYVRDTPRLPTFTYFVFGSLGGVTWAGVWSALVLIGIGSAVVAVMVRVLDLLALGDREARHLGIDVDRVVIAVLVGSGVAVGASVGLAGVIGFIGLLAPMVVRPWSGPTHRYLLPASALAGAALLTTADLVARWIGSPVEVPIGIVTAAIGGPVLVWLLVGRSRATV